MTCFKSVFSASVWTLQVKDVVLSLFLLKSSVSVYYVTEGQMYQWRNNGNGRRQTLASRTPGWNQWTDLGEVSGPCPSSLSTVLAVAKQGNKKNLKKLLWDCFRMKSLGPKKTGFDKSLVLFSITHLFPGFYLFLLFLQYLPLFPEQLIPAEVLLTHSQLWGIFISMWIPRDRQFF